MCIEEDVEIAVCMRRDSNRPSAGRMYGLRGRMVFDSNTGKIAASLERFWSEVAQKYEGEAVRSLFAFFCGEEF